jgi:GntR family transcriptional regulator
VYLLNPSSGVPLYVQLQVQVQQRILTGQLVDGEQLPSVRDLSAQLGLNPLTVSKVYQLLERDGFVETRRGLGTYVSHQAPALRLEARRRQVEPAVEQLVTEALHLGLPEREIQALLSDKFRQFKAKPGNNHGK